MLFISIPLAGMEPLAQKILAQTRGLTAEQAIEANHTNLSVVQTSSPNHTPHLNTYKCAFILGILKPAGINKLRGKISREQMGALAALKKHIGKELSLQEELDEWYWHVYLMKKYAPETSAP